MRMTWLCCTYLIVWLTLVPKIQRGPRFIITLQCSKGLALPEVAFAPCTFDFHHGICIA